MKVDKTRKSVDSLVVEGNSGKSEKTDSGKTEADISVEPSGLPDRLQVLDAQVVSGDRVDAARVSEIKQAISEGRFKVNPVVVADRLLQTVKKLIARYVH